MCDASMTKRTVFVFLLAAVLFTDSRAQTAGFVKRIVHDEKEKVDSTRRAELWRLSRLQIPVRKKDPLHLGDSLEFLQNQIWMELRINKPATNTQPRVKGRTILAEKGSYTIDALEPMSGMRFRFRQGRMSVNLKLGSISVYLNNKLVTIFGTEVFFKTDLIGETGYIFLRKGRLEFDGRIWDSKDLGKDQAWTWRGNAVATHLTGPAAASLIAGLKQEWKFDTKIGGSKSLLQQRWFQAVLAGAAIYTALQILDEGPPPPPPKFNGIITILIPNPIIPDDSR